MNVYELVVSLNSCIPAKVLCDKFLCRFDEVVVKAAPDVIKSICIIGGGCSAGSINKQINFAPGRELESMKVEWEMVNKDKMSLKYIIMDKSVLKIDFVKIEVEIQIADAPGGGSIVKGIAKYFYKCNVEVDSEDIKKRKNRAMELFEYVENYLLANPDF